MRRICSALLILSVLAQVRGQAPGTVDPNYNAPDNGSCFGSRTLQFVGPILQQPDGKLIAVAQFGCFDGGNAVIYRLNANGSLDPSFTPFNCGPAWSSMNAVYAMTLQ